MTAPIKLYFAPGTCALNPHIVIAELGLQAELIKTDIRTKKLADGSDFRAINPLGYVPVLQVASGLVLTEGPAITQYLADLKPESGLAPANGTDERYALQQWLNFISTEVHKGFSPLFNPALADDAKAVAREILAARLTFLEERLAGKDFLLFDRFTIADSYLFTVLRWTAFTGIDITQWPNLDRYVAQLRARPSVIAAMAEEGIRR